MKEEFGCYFTGKSQSRSHGFENKRGIEDIKEENFSCKIWKLMVINVVISGN